METIFEAFCNNLETSLGDNFEYVPMEDMNLMGFTVEGYYSPKLSKICGYEAYLYETGYRNKPYINLVIEGYEFEDTYILNDMEARDIVELLRRNYI